MDCDNAQFISNSITLCSPLPARSYKTMEYVFFRKKCEKNAKQKSNQKKKTNQKAKIMQTNANKMQNKMPKKSKKKWQKKQKKQKNKSKGKRNI